jgi:glycolate oxidase FAD binding subunit
MKCFMDNLTCLIDGFGPLPRARPASITELGELVQEATAEGTALYPVGGETMLTLGHAPSRPGRAIDMRGLDQVVEFAARDMTITVQAGITVARLQALLAAENLRLPIGVPCAEEATLGGILATNTSGPRRYGYGTLRDYVIGISAINDEGHEFKAGGRVVKNVAGYDLCKLLVGSLGTLGIITRATLKLRPLAEEQALVCVMVESGDVETVLARLHSSRTRPVCLDLLNAPAARAVCALAKVPEPETPWAVLVGFEGNVEAVNWQVQQLVKEIGTTCKIEARVGFTAQPLWQALIEWGSWPGAAVTFKANLLPSAVAAFCQAVEAQAPTPFLRAHAGNGIVVGHWGADLTSERAASALAFWRTAVVQGQGKVIVMRCPPAWKAGLDVWGPAPADAWLMRQIKDKFDPHRVFNPGRFVDGI